MIEQFASLSYDEQVKRLEHLAKIALSWYSQNREHHITLLQHWLNTTFRVDVYARGGKANGGKVERYTLRIHRPGKLAAQAIWSELAWLQAIHRETNLVVPEPIAALDGSLVVTAESKGVPEARHCVLLRWVEGDFRYTASELGPTELERVGVFMAKLHTHAEQFILPAGFTRSRWDCESLLNRIQITPEKLRSIISPAQERVIQATAENIRACMRSLDEQPGVFGLIHEDLHQGNYLFYNGEVRAIDFDNCGFGYYLYDIAVTFSTITQWEQYPALRAAFLKGYQSLRSLPPDYDRLIDLFISARLLSHTLWLIDQSGEPMFGERAIERAKRQLEVMQRLLPVKG